MNEIVTTRRIEGECPNGPRIKKAHLELYKLLKDRHDNKEQFHKEDLAEIYGRFVVPNKREYDRERLS